jgi:hypothetical protein
MTPTFFDAEDAVSLPPLGVCPTCGFREDPMVAIFWPTDETGQANCPTCSGEEPTEGYRCHLIVRRSDRPLQSLMGPYSPAEAERVRAYLSQLGNVESIEVIQFPEV